MDASTAVRQFIGAARPCKPDNLEYYIRTLGEPPNDLPFVAGLYFFEDGVGDAEVAGDAGS